MTLKSESTWTNLDGRTGGTDPHTPRKFKWLHVPLEILVHTPSLLLDGVLSAFCEIRKKHGQDPLTKFSRSAHEVREQGEKNQPRWPEIGINGRI